MDDDAVAVLCADYKERWLSQANSRLQKASPDYVDLCGAAVRGDGLRETDMRQIETDLKRSCAPSSPSFHS